MGVLSLVLGVTTGTEILEDDVGVVLDVVGGPLVAPVLAVELYANKVSLHVAVWDPVSETLLLLLFVGVPSVAATPTTATTGSATAASAVGESEVHGEGVKLGREVVSAADGFKTLFDGVP